MGFHHHRSVVDIGNINTEKELDAAILRLSKANPESWVTYMVAFKHCKVYLYDHKPQRMDIDTEYTYRYHGGWFHNGKVETPAPGWVQRFDSQGYQCSR